MYEIKVTAPGLHPSEFYKLEISSIDPAEVKRKLDNLMEFWIKFNDNVSKLMLDEFLKKNKLYPKHGIDFSWIMENKSGE